MGYCEAGWCDDDGSSFPKMALYSIGMGYQTRASGVASTAIGAHRTATGDHGLALGSYCQATASHAIAIGTEVSASGIHSMAFGSDADTFGHAGAVVIGDNTYFLVAHAAVSCCTPSATARAAAGLPRGDEHAHVDQFIMQLSGA